MCCLCLCVFLFVSVCVRVGLSVRHVPGLSRALQHRSGDLHMDWDGSIGAQLRFTRAGSGAPMPKHTGSERRARGLKFNQAYCSRGSESMMLQKGSSQTPLGCGK